MSTPVFYIKGATNFLVSIGLKNCVKGNAFLYHDSIAAKNLFAG